MLPTLGLRVSLIAILAGALVACTVTEEEYEDEIVEGDGVAQDEIVAERQLMGSELPNKTLTLTFDDGPGRRTAELATYLAGQGIESTFFVNGNKVPGRQAALDTVAARGHLLANHTHSHQQLTRLSNADVVREIKQTDDIISRVQPDRIAALRAPFGAWNGRVAEAVNTSGMRKYVGSVFWDVGGALTSNAGADWDCWGKGVSVERCGDLYLAEIRRKGRGIVLLHDIHDKTVDLVYYIVPKLQAEGYRFARLEDVPSVARAVGGSGSPPVIGGCSSATLGRTVPQNECVLSRSDREWYRCVAGEWVGTTVSDSQCTARHGS